MENEQSRKKRNKGRRGAGFSEGSEDFSPRRANANVNIGSLIPDMDDDDGVVRTRRSHKPKKQQAPVPVTQPMKAAKRRLRVEESIRVADMAHQMGLKSSEIIKVLFSLGTMATINSALDIDTASVVASEFGYEVEKVGFSEEQLIPSSADTPEMLKPRPPVVTIMGHVDHGKTSLLDAIRKTSVTSGEAGGITQHIGAYHVKTKKGDIVFLDTPGHAAFTAMRARGAQVTDLVVLVVAADDGVMDQTREAINHSRAAGVPILVAVNKIDKPTANPERVLRELSELGLQPEDWGGDTVVGMVSAKTGQGLDDLLELIALQAEILELKANPDKPARGHVVEAKLDKGRGPVATVLVQEGTLHQGDVFVCGVFSGRVRAMFNDQGRKIKQAGPSMPVEVQGFEGVPEAGEEFVSLEDEKAARRIAESRAAKLREKELAKASRVTLETFLKQSADTKETLVLNVVLKADVQGSLEAITESLRKLSTEKVRIEIIHGAAGAISESDVMLATASNAIIIGFNVRPTAKVKEVAEQEHVDIRFYDIIYKLVDEVKSAMAGMLAPVSKEVYLGQAEVRQTFSVPKVGLIAGCMVVDGKLTRTANVRLLRDGVVVYTGKVASLKRLKDDAKEVVRNFECGVGLDNFHDIKIGDIIEAFEMVEEAATLD
jgi:translation initiation factor IF-2